MKKNKFLFIRNDDVWTLDRSFREFFDFMLGQKIPVIYGVIPARLQEDAAVFLRRAKERNPKLLDIVQHGFAHCNHAPEGEHKYEFGPGRTYMQQFDDIVQGMRIMNRWFGEFMTPGFIPPYHADDHKTIKTIEQLNIPIYSSKLKVPLRKKRFIEVPAQIWANRIDDLGVPSPMEFHNLSRDLATVMDSRLMTGIVFRHQMMVNPGDHDVLKALIKLISNKRREGSLRIVLFSDLMRAKRKDSDQ